MRNNNKYVIILRSFLSYWLQKKFHPSVTSSSSDPDSILEEFCEAYNLQMDLVSPNVRQIWLKEFDEDPMSKEQTFIKVRNIDELRRLFAKTAYATQLADKEGHSEALFLQSFVDQDNLLDLSSCGQDVIDLNKRSDRASVLMSIKR